MNIAELQEYDLVDKSLIADTLTEIDDDDKQGPPDATPTGRFDFPEPSQYPQVSAKLGNRGTLHECPVSGCWVFLTDIHTNKKYTLLTVYYAMGSGRHRLAGSIVIPSYRFLTGSIVINPVSHGAQVLYVDESSTNSGWIFSTTVEIGIMSDGIFTPAKRLLDAEVRVDYVPIAAKLRRAAPAETPSSSAPEVDADRSLAVSGKPVEGIAIIENGVLRRVSLSNPQSFSDMLPNEVWGHLKDAKFIPKSIAVQGKCNWAMYRVECAFETIPPRVRVTPVGFWATRLHLLDSRVVRYSASGEGCTEYVFETPSKEFVVAKSQATVMMASAVVLKDLPVWATSANVIGMTLGGEEDITFSEVDLTIYLETEKCKATLMEKYDDATGIMGRILDAALGTNDRRMSTHDRLTVLKGYQDLERLLMR